MKNATRIDPTKSDKGKKPVRVVGELTKDADLAAVAKAVNAANTPHKDQSPPGLTLVLFAKLDDESAKTARSAIRKVKGVAGKGSGASSKTGAIRVRIAGEEKVTITNLLAALKEAGIEASLTKTKKE